MAFSGATPGASALDAALSQLGMPYRFVQPAPNLETWSGYLPFTRNGQRVGVEFDVFAGAAAVREAVGDAAPPGADRIASFRWGGELEEMALAYAAAAALASLVNGAVFEPSEGTRLSVDDAVRASRETTAAPPQHESRGVVEYMDQRRKADEERQRIARRMRNLAIGTVVVLFLFYLVLAEFGVVPRLD